MDQPDHMHMILGSICFSVCPVGYDMTSECNSWPTTIECTYSMNNYVPMTRNEIIRRCRNFDQVIYVLFVNFKFNHTMYVGLERSFCDTKYPQRGEMQ